MQKEMTDIRNYFGIASSLKDEQTLYSDEKLITFLDDGNRSLLIAKKTANIIEFIYELPAGDGRDILLTFFKIKPMPITLVNLHSNIFVSSMVDSPLTALYYAVDKVFTPFLNMDMRNNQHTEPKLQTLVNDLENYLRSIAIKSSGLVAENPTSSIAAIATLEDELAYWYDVGKGGVKHISKDSGRIVTNLLEPLTENLRCLESKALTEIEEFLEGAFNSLDDIWKIETIKFPQNRMENILDIIGDTVTKLIQKWFTSFSLWDDSSTDIETFLKAGLASCEKWMSICEKLTKLFWPNYTLHPWSGESFVPNYMKGFHGRLREILEIKTLCRQMTRLFMDGNIEEMSIKLLINPFSGMNALLYNTYTEPLWKAAVRQFYAGLLPMEQKAAVQLKSHLNKCKSSILKLLQEVRIYNDLLMRPTIQEVLLADRESLLNHIQNYMVDLQPTIKIEPVGDTGMPKVIKKLYHVKKLQVTVNNINIISSTLFKSLVGYKKLVKLIVIVQNELNEYQTELLSIWTDKILSALRNTNLGLKTNDVVVSFGENKMMRVNFSPEMVNLVKEVRLISMMGYKINQQILNASVTAQKFVSHARVLNQVATFHNEVADRMIFSQQAMMLKAARTLSKLVQKQNTVKWSNTKLVNDYVRKMQSAVEILARQNFELIGYHDEVRKKIMELMDTSLTDCYRKWKEGMNSIRLIIGEVEDKYTNTKLWRMHIDSMLYEALEYQYRLGLAGFKDVIPEYKLELICRKNKAHFIPHFRNIISYSFKKLRSFILIPSTIRPLGDRDVYSKMILLNAGRFRPLLFRLKTSLLNLHKMSQRWSELVIYQPRKIETYAEMKLKRGSDWASNFKASKYFAQELATISSCDVKIGNFVINVAGLKLHAESQNRMFWDELKNRLHSSMMFDLDVVTKFLAQAMPALKASTHEVDDIAEANRQHEDILVEGQKVLPRLEQLDKKNRVLQIWVKDNVGQVDKVKSEWYRFQQIITEFHFTMEKEVEEMKVHLVTEIQEYIDEVESFQLRWVELRPREDRLLEPGVGTKFVQDSINIIAHKRAQWGEIMEKILSFKEKFVKLHMEPPIFERCDEIDKELQKYEKTWSLLEEFRNGVREITSHEWIIIRKTIYEKFDTFLLSWEEKLKPFSTSPVVVKLKQLIDRYKEILPALKYIRGDTFTEKHWLEVFTLLKAPYKPIQDITFSDFLFLQDKITKNIDALEGINNRAAGEVVIRHAISELDIWEVEAKFSVTKYNDSKGRSVTIIKDFRSVLNKVGDHMCLMQSVRGSPNFEYFEDRINSWDKRLVILDGCIRNLSQIQRKWVYLEPIMMNTTLEQVSFELVDKQMKYILKELEKSGFRVVALSRIKNVCHYLEELLVLINKCQKCLMDFLEKKRLLFPRFYFLSDDDLLEIIGQSNKHYVIQSHLKKIFSGIHTVLFEENTIVAICSSNGELVKLRNPVIISREVEYWLVDLEKEMKSTLKELVKLCVEKFDPLNFPSQILCLCERIKFTTSTEKAIVNNNLKELKVEIEGKLNSYSKQRLEHSRDRNNKDSVILEIKYKALLLDTIYHLSVIEALQKEFPKINTINDWRWQKCLRFYMAKDGSVVVKMVDAEFNYSYEYQGNSQKLVHTQLTDKCYLTLTQAMDIGLGGNLYGPAGTGKTESVKALGGLLGRQVLVFNCDEGIDVHSLSRILIGLIKCGAWGCFDEFNRLEEVTLSSISQQIHSLQHALRTGAKTVTILEKKIQIDVNTAIFVTLNPASKGYGGRQKLPENLKQLFRPVIMAKPDDTDIVEVILHCEGFSLAKEIAKKLVVLFSLASKLLSSQKHYDWGLRALKTVVGGCGSSLKEYLSTHETSDKSAEMKLVVQAVRLNTLSKLSFTDGERFENLVKNVFPGIQFVSMLHDKLKNAIKESFRDLNLPFNERQSSKCLELYEQLQQRMGVVIVGPPSSGKTTLVLILKQALGKLGGKVRHHIINPKALPKHKLLGQIDVDTREWTDGVLTTIAQQVFNESSDIDCWIQCDGDIDPEWVESLNSVLDDNRLLTLPSGWRIQFGSNVHFLFETHDLSNASPATVSRLGMILLSNEDIEITDVVDAWIETQKSINNAETSELIILNELVESYFFKALKWVFEDVNTVLRSPVISVVKNGLSLMYGVKSKANFIVALINGLGANLEPSFKESFALQVFELTNENPPDMTKPHYCYYNQDEDIIEAHETSVSSTENNLPLVRTPYINVNLDIITHWLDNDQHFIITGPQGCGKRMLLEYCFKRIRGAQIVKVFCSAETTPFHVIEKLSQVCMILSSSSGRIYRPKNSDKVIVHISDINLARSDKWGTAMLIAFLQQVITYNGFYDADLEWVGLEKIQIASSLTSIETLSPRFVSLNRILYMRYPGYSELNEIYGIHIKHLFRHLEPDLTISTDMVDVYKFANENFTPMEQAQFIFSPRDLTQWCINLLRYHCQTRDHLYEALLYEGMRIFKDRLVTEEDKEQFEEIMTKHFRHLDVQLNADCLYVTNISLNANYHTSENVISMPVGLPLIQMKLADWTTDVRKYMLQYGGESFIDSHIIIPEFLRNVAFIDRGMTNGHGGILLVGKTGIGRKTALRVVATKHKAKIISPKMISHYSEHNFKHDLKSVIHQAGVEGELVYFLLEDYHISHSEFLSMINSLISSGEVPGLYQNDEIEKLSVQLKESMYLSNFSGSVQEYLAIRVQQYLRVILIFNHDHPNFNANLKQNPAILKHCNVLWFLSMSLNSMKYIPAALVSRAQKDYQFVDSQQNKPVISTESFPIIHESAGKFTNVTPKQYLIFVEIYLKIFKEKLSSITDQQARLEAGVSKLTEARNTVDNLKRTASKQQELLAEKKMKSKKVLDQISFTLANANTRKSEMEELRVRTENQNTSLKSRKLEIDKELSEIEPLVQEARAAVGNIKSESLSEIRSLRIPPQIIRDILEGVLRLMGIRDTTWNSMKNFLAKRGVKEDIRCFNASLISDENREAVESLLAKRSNSFDPQIAKRASLAAAPLATWVKANVKYSYVLKNIKPLEDEQARLKKNLELAAEQVKLLASGLNSAEEVVGKLHEQLNNSSKEAVEIEIQLSKAQETISAAEELVLKLDDEFSMWKFQLAELSSSLNTLSINCILSAAIITYLSGCTEDTRKNVMKSWQQLTGYKRKFSIIRFLCSERELLQWGTEGLPADETNRQNAIIICHTKLVPLLLDPSHIALNWLKTNFSSQNTELISQQNPNFHNMIEVAVRFGKTLIIQDLTFIDPLLVPVLRRDFIYQGLRRMVMVGDKLVDFNPEFKLFMVSKLINIHISSDYQSLLTIVNFNITKEGLEQQLLELVLTSEKPNIKTRRNELLHGEETLQTKLFKIQDEVLKELANAHGNILQNQDLLSSLQESKRNALAIKTSIGESKTLQRELKKDCEVYQPLAKFGAQLFFTCRYLSNVNNMYHFSITSFLNIFQFSLLDSKRINDIPLKCDLLLDTTYKFISRSIFRSDRLAFALHLVHEMFPTSFHPNEWEILTGQYLEGTRVDINEIKNKIPDWIPHDRAHDVYTLQIALPEMYSRLQLDNKELWRDFIKSPIPVMLRHCVLSEFERLLVFRALKPVGLYKAMVEFSMKTLRIHDLSPSPLQLNKLCDETTENEPVLLITSPGADPSEEIRELAKTKMNNNFYEVVMSQDQILNILNTLSKASKLGQWVIIKNLHLSISLLSNLEKTLQSLHPHHKSFRLWLTSEPHSNFSTVLLSSCLKVTCEAPAGVKHNLERTISTWSSSWDAMTDNMHGARALLALAWFHAVIQERRTFIPQGWTNFYEFNDNDLAVAANIIVKRLGEWTVPGKTKLELQYIRGLFESAIYGGRIDNPYDLNILSAYLLSFFNSEVVIDGRPVAQALGVLDTPNIKGILNLVSKLPDKDLIEYFGLPQNVDRLWQNVASLKTLSQLQDLTNLSSHGETLDKKEFYKLVAPMLKLWKKLNQGINLKVDAPKDGNDKFPVASFFINEYAFAASLVSHVHKSLANVSKVIKGIDAEHDKAMKFASSVSQQKTPEEWDKFWTGPAHPMHYLRCIMGRFVSLQNTVVNELKDIWEKPLDLGDIYHVDTFLNSLQLQCARSLKTPLEDLSLRISWIGGTHLRENSVLIKGLLLEGALFEEQRLCECLPESPNVTEFPQMTLTWDLVPKRFIDYAEVPVPLYSSSNRNEIITELILPCNRNERNKWIKTGVAFYVRT